MKIVYKYRWDSPLPIFVGTITINKAQVIVAFWVYFSQQLLKFQSGEYLRNSLKFKRAIECAQRFCYKHIQNLTNYSSENVRQPKQIKIKVLLNKL